MAAAAVGEVCGGGVPRGLLRRAAWFPERRERVTHICGSCRGTGHPPTYMWPLWSPSASSSPPGEEDLGPPPGLSPQKPRLCRVEQSPASCTQHPQPHPPRPALSSSLLRPHSPHHSAPCSADVGHPIPAAELWRSTGKVRRSTRALQAGSARP